MNSVQNLDNERIYEYDYRLPKGRKDAKYYFMLKYKVKNRINLGCEFSFRKLFGDGLDVTDDSNAFLDDPYHMKGSFLKNKDWYSFLLFTVTWDFGPRCRTCNNAKNIDNIQ